MTDDDMAWAIFHLPFSYDRRPRQAVAFVVSPKAEAQSYPRDVVDAAVAAGKAEEIRPPKRDERVGRKRR